jgi:hypothetical protein
MAEFLPLLEPVGSLIAAIYIVSHHHRLVALERRVFSRS